MQKNKLKLPFGVLLVMLTMLPMVLLSAVNFVLSTSKLKSSLEDSNRQAVESVCFSLMEAYDTLYEGNWSMVNGNLYKGANYVGHTQDLLNRFYEEKNLNVTLFYGDTRVLTTLKDANGDYIVGTQADEKVSSQVLAGNSYFNENLVVNGVPSYVAYEPLRNMDGTVVGMVFVGYPRSIAQKAINNAIISLIIGTVIVLGVILVIVVIMVRVIVRAMTNLTGAVTKLGSGDLNVELHVDALNQRNEIGALADNVNNLVVNLRGIMNGIQRDAETLNDCSIQLTGSVDTTISAISQVTKAIEEVAEGSTTQAQDTAGAMANIEELNATLDIITDKVVTLSKMSDETKKVSNHAQTTMVELIDINTQTKTDIDNIVEQSEKNVEAVNKINVILKTIEEISSQTNLLSLNASIEAARAGEAGRGFAVVAKEIGSLAESCASAAREIQEIIVSLVEDIQKTSSLSDVLNESATKQLGKIQDTRAMFDKVLNAVGEISQGTERIREEVVSINAVKNGIGETIESLSSISEENAAASEETTASANLVNEDMKQIGQVSQDMLALAEGLKKAISFFH
ncbi:MAG: HAMP domain-containing protein [Lachnospiraceae bacterium]|nr:HAMP domain-containing protein [Lachnospiraceae bacterium]